MKTTRNMEASGVSGQDMKGRYVYCFTPSTGMRRSFGNIGIETSGEVYTIDHRAAAAVVSDSPVKEYEPNPQNAMAHDSAIRVVMADSTVVPLAFGMVFKDETTLISVMEASYEAIMKSLEAVDGKVELGVKVILPKEEFGSPDNVSPEANDRVRQEAATEFLSALEKAASQSREGRLFSSRLVLNASFLVDKARVEEFSQVLGELDDRHPFLKVQYTGPWAPYSFVSIKIAGSGPRGGRTRW